MSHFVTNTKKIPLLNNEIINGLKWPFLPWGRIGSWPHLEHTGASAIHIHGFMECFVCVSGRLLVSVVKTHVLSSFIPSWTIKRSVRSNQGRSDCFFGSLGCWTMIMEIIHYQKNNLVPQTRMLLLKYRIQINSKFEPRDGTLKNVTSKVAIPSNHVEDILM